MANILLSMAGEGRGHATRAQALHDRLAHQHRVGLVAGGDAEALLRSSASRAGAGSAPLRSIPVPRFRYTRAGRLSYGRTGLAALRYLGALPGLTARMRGVLREERIDLAVSDLEPALPRAARRAGVPLLSLSHQRLLVAGDFSFLPATLRGRIAGMAAVVRWLAPEGDRTVVSSFYAPPLRSAHAHVRSVGVLLRRSVRDAQPTLRGHLLAYLRRAPDPAFLHALAGAGRVVHVYGAGVHEDHGPLRFRALDPEAFVSDLAASDGLVCSAGNQLLGEARALRKPVLAIPEPGNFEQLVNAHLLALSGAGIWVERGRLNQSMVAMFAERLGDLAGRIPRGEDGTPEVVGEIEGLLGRARQPLRSDAQGLATQRGAA